MSAAYFSPSTPDEELAEIAASEAAIQEAMEVKPVVDNPLFSFVVGIASSLVAAWLYDMIRHSGKH